MIKLLDINSTGDIRVAPVMWNYLTQSSNFNALAEDRTYYSVNTSSGIVTATLPAATVGRTGLVLGFKRKGANRLVISSSDLVDGASTVNINVNNTYYEVICTGTTWEAK